MSNWMHETRKFWMSIHPLLCLRATATLLTLWKGILVKKWISFIEWGASQLSISTVSMPSVFFPNANEWETPTGKWSFDGIFAYLSELL